MTDTNIASIPGITELKVKCRDTDSISDGHHTFGELYEHRHLLYLSMLKTRLFASWRSKLHHDGIGYDGWFLVGSSVFTPGHEVHGEQISYHLPMRLWDLCNWMDTYDCAPVAWDGHSSDDVLDRMRKFLMMDITYQED
jgi:hypothetical protein